MPCRSASASLPVATWNSERRSISEAAALFLDFTDLSLDQADLFARVFQFGGDGGLALRGNLSGVGDPFAKGGCDAFEALGDILPDGLDLACALSLGSADGLEIPAEIGQLLFEDVTFFLASGGLQSKPDDHSYQHDRDDDQGKIHGFARRLRCAFLALC
jgi:hypothetical protein